MQYINPPWVQEFAEKKGLNLSKCKRVLGVIESAEKVGENQYKIVVVQDALGKEHEAIYEGNENPHAGDFAAILYYEDQVHGVVNNAHSKWHFGRPQVRLNKQLGERNLTLADLEAYQLEAEINLKQVEDCANQLKQDLSLIESYKRSLRKV